MKLPGSAICKKARDALVEEVKISDNDLAEVRKRNEATKRESQSQRSSLGSKSNLSSSKG